MLLLSWTYSVLFCMNGTTSVHKSVLRYTKLVTYIEKIKMTSCWKVVNTQSFNPWYTNLIWFRFKGHYYFFNSRFFFQIKPGCSHHASNWISWNFNKRGFKQVLRLRFKTVPLIRRFQKNPKQKKNVSLRWKTIS